MSVSRLVLGAMVVFAAVSSSPAAQVGQIYACYACQSSGNAAVDAALTANPGVASDGLLFAFVNTSSSAISSGIFSVSGTTPGDAFTLPVIGAGATYILIPGVSSDSGAHPSGGLFAVSGVQDTSDGAGGVSDSSLFRFTGMDGGLSVMSLTAGTSTAVAGTFTAGDPGLIKPFRDNPSNGSTSFLGLGPSGDGGCTNCYFGLIATLNTPVPTAGIPEPATSALLIAGLGLAGLIARRHARPSGKL